MSARRVGGARVLAALAAFSLGALSMVAVSLAAGTDDRPRLAADARGRLAISGLPAILGDEEVKRHLDSGLTTSFVLEARSPGSGAPGAARVDIRLELWDEVYLVTVIDGAARLEETRHESIAALEEWWSQVEIVLSDSPAPAAAADSRARVSLAVVPFSQAELVDTQRWLAESIGQAQGGSPAGRPGGASRAVSALIATSMQRRAVRSMSWSLPVEPRADP